MNINQEPGNPFVTLSPTKLFFHCALPSMASMAFASLYTVADGILVGRFLGERALAAVNLVMPLVMISFALADMVAVGSSVQIAIHMGKGQQQKANRIFSFACGMIFLLSIVIGVVGFLSAPFLLSLFGADPEVSALAVSYLRVYAGFAPLVMCFFAVDNYLRICGKVRYSMWMNIVISIANILLDLLFLGVFRLGIASAAVSSCICLAAGSIICFWPFVRKKLSLRFVRGKISFSLIRNIIANGSSEFFSNIAGSICMMLFNAVLLRLSGYLAVAAFSIIMYIDSIVKSMLFGMGDALQPAISYHYGAGKTKRLFAIERRVQLAAAIVSLATMACMWLFGEALIGLFLVTGNPELHALSTRAMHLFSLSYFVSWIGFISSSFFTAVDRPLQSLAASLCQTLLFPLAALSILPTFLGLDGVWLSMFAAGICSLLLVLVLFRSVSKKLK